MKKDLKQLKVMYKEQQGIMYMWMTFNMLPFKIRMDQ
jgi:hypothetical protein